jgi:hypothetical protein
MRRLNLVVSAVPLLVVLGSTVAFTNNDVTIRERQSSARRRVLYSAFLSGLDSSPEETPTGKTTEHRSKPFSDAGRPSTEKSSTPASSLPTQHHKETAPKPVELKAALGETAKPPVARTDFPYLKEWNTEGDDSPYLDHLIPTAEETQLMPLFMEPKKAADVDLPSVKYTTSTLSNFVPILPNDLSSALEAAARPKAPPMAVAETTDLQFQFGQILKSQLETTKQLGMSISELREIQQQQGQFIQIMALNDIEMTQMMVSVRDDLSEMKTDMRQSQTQQDRLEGRLSALEINVVELAASPEPAASIPIPAGTANVDELAAPTAMPQKGLLDTISNAINVGRALGQGIRPLATTKTEASAPVASAERKPSVTVKESSDVTTAGLSKKHTRDLALMTSYGVFGTLVQSLLHAEVGLGGSEDMEQKSLLDTSSSVPNTSNVGRALVQDSSAPATKNREASAEEAKRQKRDLALMISYGVYGILVQNLLYAEIGFGGSEAMAQNSLSDTFSKVSNTSNVDMSTAATPAAKGLTRKHKQDLALMISCGVYGIVLQNLLPTEIGYGRSEKLDISSIQGTSNSDRITVENNVEAAALRQKSSETSAASVPTFVGGESPEAKALRIEDLEAKLSQMDQAHEVQLATFQTEYNQRKEEEVAKIMDDLKTDFQGKLDIELEKEKSKLLSKQLDQMDELKTDFQYRLDIELEKEKSKLLSKQLDQIPTVDQSGKLAEMRLRQQQLEDAESKLQLALKISEAELERMKGGEKKKGGFWPF